MIGDRLVFGDSLVVSAAWKDPQDRGHHAGAWRGLEVRRTSRMEQDRGEPAGASLQIGRPIPETSGSARGGAGGGTRRRTLPPPRGRRLEFGLRPPHGRRPSHRSPRVQARSWPGIDRAVQEEAPMSACHSLPATGCRRRRFVAALGFILGLFFAAGPALAQDPAPPTLNDSRLQLRPLVEDLVTPISIAFLGPDDLFVLEKNTGRVVRVTEGVSQGA